jgi:pyrroloquinoline quinone biosynthesis protein D
MGHVHDQNRHGGGGRVRLAPGIVLTRESEPETATLVLMDGKVRLNEHALAILSLCDGSRSRDRVVIDAMVRTAGGMRAADIVEFLDAAHARGWVVDIR